MWSFTTKIWKNPEIHGLIKLENSLGCFFWPQGEVEIMVAQNPTYGDFWGGVHLDNPTQYTVTLLLGLIMTYCNPGSPWPPFFIGWNLRTTMIFSRGLSSSKRNPPFFYGGWLPGVRYEFKKSTLPKTNSKFTPENRPSFQKETRNRIPTIHVQGRKC